LQAKVVERLWPGYSETWVSIMKRSFHIVDREGHKVSSCVYATGQPMGMLSSWAVFSLTHHIVTQTIFRKLGEKPKYWLLGDDVVIGSTRAGKEYLSVMDKLGVEISLAKSVISESGEDFEFTKRRIKGGLDVSPIS